MNLLSISIALSVTTYVVVSTIVFGNPFQPINLITLEYGKFGVPYWQEICLSCIAVSAAICLVPTKYIYLRMLKLPSFVALILVFPTIAVGLRANLILRHAVVEFGADEYIDYSFFLSIRNVPEEFQYFVHAAAIKDCVPYAWSYRTLSFYILPSNVAVNVLPSAWIKKCGIHITRS